MPADNNAGMIFEARVGNLECKKVGKFALPLNGMNVTFVELITHILYFRYSLYLAITNAIINDSHISRAINITRELLLVLLTVGRRNEF